MPKMRPKFIAKGFREDLANLVDKFIKKRSFELKEFAEIWRSLHFSLIFLGREEKRELKEFTEEVFRITVEHLDSTNIIYRNVALIYALYALYLKQPLEPKVKIRLDLEHWQVVLNVLKYSVENNYRVLCYVINVLMFKPAFNFVAHPRLMGPFTTPPHDSDEVFDLKKIIKLNEETEDLVNSGIFESLSKIDASYIEAKKKLATIQPNNLDLVPESSNYDATLRDFKLLLLDDTNEGNIQNNLHKDEMNLMGKEQHNDEMNLMVNEQPNNDLALPSSSKYTEDIGTRRAQIKRTQFEKSIDYLPSGKEEQTSSDDEIIPLLSKIKESKKKQKNETSVIQTENQEQNSDTLFIDDADESDEIPKPPPKKRGRKSRRPGKVGRPRKVKEPKKTKINSDGSLEDLSENEQVTTGKQRPSKIRCHFDT